MFGVVPEMDPTGIGAEIIRQIPAVAAIIYVVNTFLRSLDRRDDNIQRITKDWAESRKQMMDHFQGVVDRNNLVIEHVVAAIATFRMKGHEEDRG